eukprot:9128551-Pyramimonas_sp.AAC.1
MLPPSREKDRGSRFQVRGSASGFSAVLGSRGVRCPRLPLLQGPPPTATTTTTTMTTTRGGWPGR